MDAAKTLHRGFSRLRQLVATVAVFLLLIVKALAEHGKLPSSEITQGLVIVLLVAILESIAHLRADQRKLLKASQTFPATRVISRDEIHDLFTRVMGRMPGPGEVFRIGALVFHGVPQVRRHESVAERPKPASPTLSKFDKLMREVVAHPRWEYRELIDVVTEERLDHLLGMIRSWDKRENVEIRVIVEPRLTESLELRVIGPSDVVIGVSDQVFHRIGDAVHLHGASLVEFTLRYFDRCWESTSRRALPILLSTGEISEGNVAEVRRQIRSLSVGPTAGWALGVTPPIAASHSGGE